MSNLNKCIAGGLIEGPMSYYDCKRCGNSWFFNDSIPECKSLLNKTCLSKDCPERTGGECTAGMEDWEKEFDIFWQRFFNKEDILDPIFYGNPTIIMQFIRTLIEQKHKKAREEILNKIQSIDKLDHHCKCEDFHALSFTRENYDGLIHWLEEGISLNQEKK